MTNAPTPDRDPANEFKEIVYRAAVLALQNRHEYVTLEHLTAALLENDEIKDILKQLGADSDALVSEIEDYLNSGVIPATVGRKKPSPTQTFDAVVARSIAASQLAGRIRTPSDLLVQVLTVNAEDNFAVTILMRHGLSHKKVQELLGNPNSAAGPKRQIGPDGEPMQVPGQINTQEEAEKYLAQYSQNLNLLAADSKIDPLIGRETEVDNIIQISARRTKNNAVLVGEPGVGKTAIAEGLALKIIRKEVPDILLETTIYSLDIGALVAGTRFRGDFEERMKLVIKSLEFFPGSILFIDEIHTVMGAGGGSGSLDVANLLKPALAKGTLRCIGSTTEDEFRKHFEKDKAMLRRFKKVSVYEPSVEDAKAILKGLRSYYESFHGVTFTDEACDAAVDLTHRYITNSFLPDKAIDIIDQAGARQRITNADVRIVSLGVEQIEVEVAKVARIPAQLVHEDEGEKLGRLETELGQTVFGQELALVELTDAVFLSRAGLRKPNRPAGSYLFAGPTGVGKTESARTLAKVLGVPMIKYDMSEYMEEHSVARLIGAPPGYIGHDDGGKLVNDIDAQPYCVLLLDEIEKAHQKVLNVLLQIMDDGVLTSSTGKKTYFRNVIIIMTTNVGVQEASKNAIGFKAGASKELDLTGPINRHFSPEFRNRLDAVVQFGKLTPDNMIHIVDKFLAELGEMTLARNVTLSVSDAAKAKLGALGYDKDMGARPLDRVIGQQIKKPLSRLLLTGALVRGGVARVELVDDKIEILGFAHGDPALPATEETKTLAPAT